MPLYLPPADADPANWAGREADYAERSSSFTTTNTVVGGTAAAALIPELILEVTGIGRPVSLEFYCGAVYNTVANNYVDPYFLVDGVGSTDDGTIGAGSSPSTTTGRATIAKRRLVIPAGVTKTFQVGIAGQSGTSTVLALPSGRMYFCAVYQ